MTRIGMTKLFVILGLAVLLTPLARADTLTATLVTQDVTVLQGTTLVQFFATVSNPSLTDTVYLNFDQTSASTGLTIDDSLFALNAPLFLSPGASSGPFEIFDAILATNLAAGLYTGTFTILGGPDGGTFTATDDLADLNFSVTVTTPSTATPEPRTMVLLLCAFSLWGLLQVWFARIKA